MSTLVNGHTTEELVVSGLGKSYGKVVAVDHLSFHVKKGEFFGLLGPSGCGKSTTLKMIAGLEDPDRGDIFLKGKRINDIPVHKRQTAMVFQNYALFPHMTAFNNVAFGLKMLKVDSREMKRKVQEILALIRLPDVGDRYPSQLSGGQQQRVGIARAVAMGPKVLLLDEITSALDPELVGEVLSVVQELAREGMTMIVVTHEMTFARDVGTRIVFMDGGRIQVEGSPREVLAKTDHERLRSFLARIEMKHH